MAGSASVWGAYFKKKCYNKDSFYLDKRWKRPPLSKQLGPTAITVAIAFSQSQRDYDLLTVWKRSKFHTRRWCLIIYTCSSASLPPRQVAPGVALF